MSKSQINYFLVLLFFMPFSILAQKAVNPRLTTSAIDLSDKTFVIGNKGEVGKNGNDLDLLLIFHKNGDATFRVKRGITILKDNSLTWRFVGDSLYIRNSPITLEAEGKTQLIEREPMKYAIEKTTGGYLLNRKDDQMILIELK